MDWINVLLSLFKSRREQREQERTEAQDAIAEWRSIANQYREDRAELNVRLLAIEVRQRENIIAQAKTEAQLAAQTIRLEACLEECKECHDSREELKREVDELKRQISGRGQ